MQVLAEDVGAIRFLEWKQGSVRVPCVMPGWIATQLWDLLRSGDEEIVGCMASGPHSLTAVEMDGWAIDTSGSAREFWSISVFVFVCMGVCVCGHRYFGQCS